jgi:hypothetical protein
METTEKTFGVCRYCGQLLNIKSYLTLHPNIDDPDEDGIATLVCDCKEACRAREAYQAALHNDSDRFEALQKANDVIKELFSGNPHQKRMAVDEQTREILQQLAERVYGGFVDKAVITTTDGVKATVKSTGSAAIGIAIERSETKKEKKEI